MADEVLTEARGRVLCITLNRPDARNAVNTALAHVVASVIEARGGTQRTVTIADYDMPLYDQDECYQDGDASLIVPPAYTIDNLGNIVPCTTTGSLASKHGSQ